MKNDIDAILDSMFRGGRLHFKSSQPGEKERGEKPRTAPPTQAPIEAAAANAQQAQQALDAVERTGDSLSESLQASLERLTQEAKADMADLERHLRQDGVTPPLSPATPGTRWIWSWPSRWPARRPAPWSWARRNSWTGCSSPLSGPFWPGHGGGPRGGGPKRPR